MSKGLSKDDVTENGRKGTVLGRLINLALFSILVIALSVEGFLLLIKLKQS